MKRWTKQNVGNCIFLLGLFALLMVNLNTFELYQKATKYNYLFAAVIMTAAFVCVVNLKEIVADKLLWCVVAIDIVAFLFICISGTGLAAYIPLYCLTTGLYLFNKVLLNKWQTIVTIIMCGAFFVYWTIDVKGYFKGYSINFGGLVLLYGFVFVILIVEFFKYKILSGEFLKDTAFASFIAKYPYYIAMFEAIFFIWAYKIMAWYRSRTAVAALIVFAVFMCVPGRVTFNKLFQRICVIAGVIGGCLCPVVYCYAAKLGRFADSEIFYKPVIGSRVDVWSYLYELIKTKPIIGNGTIIVPEGNVFRPGLLDTCNTAVQLITVHGIIVALAVLALLGYVVCKLLAGMNNKSVSRVFLAGFMAIIVLGYAENSIMSAPFIMMFVAFCYVGNSVEKVWNISYDIDLCYKNSAMYTGEFRDKFAPVFSVTAMLFVMYLILGPLEIFYSNYNEWEFNSFDFMGVFTLITFAGLIIIPLIIASIPTLVSFVYSAGIFAFGVGSYIQYMFINGDLVDNEGNFVLDLNMGARYYISIAVFLIVIVVVATLTVIYKQKAVKAYGYGAAFITLIMMAATITICVGLLGLEDKKKDILNIDATDEYEFAYEDNTIVLVLDTFGRSVLDEQLAADPDAVDFLHDFTFYKNHDSVYCPTFPSLYHLMTEYEYTKENDENYEYDAFASDSAKKFFDELHEAGYYAGIYSIDVHPKDSMVGKIDNVGPCKVSVNKTEVRKKLFDLSMYRYLPYNLKAAYQVYNPKDGTVSYDTISPTLYNDAFYSRMKEWGMHINEKYEKKLTLSHLFGIHAPVANNENCEKVEYNSVSRVQRTAGVLKLVSEYLDGLKELGIYDNSTIIVMADHGELGATDSIFFIKEPYEEHDALAVDDTEVTHHDFQKIILESLR